eukprot:1139030-Prymnesium_polylepis.1
MGGHTGVAAHEDPRGLRHVDVSLRRVLVLPREGARRHLSLPRHPVAHVHLRTTSREGVGAKDVVALPH